MSGVPTTPAGLPVRLWSAPRLFPRPSRSLVILCGGRRSRCGPAFPFSLSENASTTLSSLRSSEQYSNGAAVQASGSDARAQVEG